MIDNKFSRTFSLLGMRVELISNYRNIIFDDEYFLSRNGRLHSLLSNFGELLPLPPSDGPPADVRINLEDTPDALPEFEIGEGSYTFRGSLKFLEEGCEDKRASIFGNMGIFSKILVRELERRGIYSFHSTSFIQPGTNRIYLVLGGSGAGKSTVLLKAVKEGYQVFGTELTHFSLRENRIVFHRGSLWQNCRMGNLVEDFPSLIDKFSITDIPEGNPWHHYLSVDLKPWQYPKRDLDDPEIVILFPRIESGRVKSDCFSVEKESVLLSAYENLSDKVSPPSHVYKEFFIPTIDAGKDQIQRMKACEEFIKIGNIRDCWKYISGPDNCLDEVII